MDIQSYLNNIRSLAQSGQATEHSYRPALAGLFKSIDENLTVINEPKQSAVGAPDFVFARNGVSIGWCEAKDLRKDISRFGAGDYSREQKERYKKGLPNLIYTNGTDFEFIREGEVTGFVSIADLIPNLPPRPDEFPRLEMMLKDFSAQTPISINSAKQLAKMMAGKAVIIKDIMGNALMADKNNNIETELTDQYEGFKKSLIHDITIADFADVYAETIAYGLFAARLHDHSLGTFNRAEALELLPKSNPFLRDLFVYIAGNNLDERLRRMIDDLCDVFRACDVGALMQDFGKFTARNDPFLHFYETFLAEYNPAKRKARGVWYTPKPVVNFIVRAVDDVLKTEFNLPRGIADTSKIQIDWDTGQNDGKTGKPLTIKKDVHRVQILDPATGTGTFLAEAIEQIAEQVKDIAPGMWSGYVEENLIPRLHGFELLMASYAMCHLKLDMMLTELEYKPSSTPPRLGVYLTNSLEEGDRVEQKFEWARFISKEAKGANTIKRDTPIMCIIGNPPYSGESANKGDWIMGLMEAYKKEPGGKERLNEKNSKWINDDYVKFIRFAEYMIQKNGEGILGFITNHGYLDNPTFRGMRWHLLDTFDKIYILDLHGNLKRKEMSPDGSADKNVFDIQPGVAIIIGVKSADIKNVRPALSSVYRSDLWGNRQSKYDALWTGEIGTPNWTKIAPASPDFNFTDTDEQSSGEYRKGFNLAKLMSVGGVGICSKRDPIAYHDTVGELTTVLHSFRDLPALDIAALYHVQTESRDQKVVYAKANVIEYGIKDEYYQKVTYRPFDNRWTYYTNKVRGFLAYPVYDKLRHLTKEYDNVALIVGRQGQAVGGDDWDLVLATSVLTDLNIFRRGGGVTHPLYLYPEEGTLETERRVNFDPKIYAEIKEKAGLSGVDGDELKVFDYIYGVLHSPDYRATYAQFLKIDFPRIPYPASPEVFAHVAEKGGALRRLHLMEDAAIGDTPFPFVGDGDTVVGKPVLTDDGRVMINPDQYFDNVPRIAWEFHIGGYQPAQKWLKDRKGRALSFDDVVHYQKIIKILSETDRIMRDIILPL
jgi:predicted helicase